METVKKKLVDFDIKRQIIKISLVEGLGKYYQNNFLRKILKMYLSTMGGLKHFHVLPAIVDIGLIVKWHSTLIAISSLAVGGINPESK